MLDMPLWRYAEERNYVRRFFALMRRFDDGTRFNALGLCCRHRPFNGFHLDEDTKHWWRE